MKLIIEEPIIFISFCLAMWKFINIKTNRNKIILGVCFGVNLAVSYIFPASPIYALFFIATMLLLANNKQEALYYSISYLIICFVGFAMGVYVSLFYLGNLGSVFATLLYNIVYVCLFIVLTRTHLIDYSDKKRVFCLL